MTIRSAALVLGLTLALPLAACGQKGSDEKAATSGSEVLPGSISDDMIDLDTSTASPPMAPVKAEAKEKTSAKADDATEPEDAAAPEQAAAEAPADSGDTE